MNGTLNTSNNTMMSNNEFIYFLSRNKQIITHGTNLLRPIMNFYPTQNLMINNYELSSYFNKPYIHHNSYDRISQTQQINPTVFNIINESIESSNNQKYNKSNIRSNGTNNFPQRNNYLNFDNDLEEVPKIKFPEIVHENSTEADKWLAARKRNFPYLEKKAILEEKNQEQYEKGLISKLELKLREKIKIMNRIGKRVKKKQEKKEYETLKKEMNTKFRNDQKTKTLKENVKESKVLSKRAKRRQRNKNKDNTSNRDNLNTKLEEVNDEAIIIGTNEKINHGVNENAYTSTKPIFSYHKNTILQDIFKDEFNKELGIILQSLFYFEKEGLLEQ